MEKTNYRLINFFNNINRSTRVNLIIISISLLLLVLFGFMNPKFISVNNFINMGHQMAITAVIAFAMTAVILAKGIDLSVGSTLAVSGIIGALAFQNGMNSFTVLLIIIFASAVIGALNGFLITNLKISPFIATLGTMAFGHGAALSLSNASSVSIQDPVINWAGSTMLGPIPVTIIFTLLLLLFWWILLNRSTTGRYVYALGGNYEAAKASAVKVKLIQFLTYVATGISAGVASILLIGRVQSAQPLGGMGLEFDVITGVIIGGTLLSGGVGTVLGTLFGVILVTIIRTGLSFFGAPQEITYLVTGGMVLLSVILYSSETIDSIKKWKFRLNKTRDSNLSEKKERNSNVIKLNNIGKSYSGFQALTDIEIEIKTGEVVALVGENGAGKSTLVKILSGIISPSQGNIEINGNSVVFDSAKQSREAGIGVVHQHYSLVPELTITENLFLGREVKFKGLPFLSRRIMRKKTQQLLNNFNLDIDPNMKVNELTVGQRQLVEVVKATIGNPWFMIMDEPTSSLSKSESERLYQLIDELRKRNVAILYISHKMDELYKLCDRAVILRDGKFIGNADLPETSEDTIVSMMVGRKIDNIFPYTKSEIGEVAIEVENISDGGLLKDATFNVRKGEIVVLAGLMGSGRTEILNTIFGISKLASGKVKIEGREVRNMNPVKMYQQFEMAYIPEDRHASGFIPTLSVAKNLTLAWIQKHSKFGFFSLKKEKQKISENIKRMNIRPPDPNKLVDFLSGGNQQKVVLGKWLLTNPKILFLDDPTRGVDVGAKAEIHELIAELKKQGVAILIVSSELTEALNVGDRIIVMHEGRSVGELKHGATEEQVMNYALGIMKDNKNKEVQSNG